MMKPSPIDEVLRKRKIIVTCGTGGVGKTTLSAAIALRSALLGRKTVVITIDPAKRLATSLGLDELGDHPTDLTEKLREAARKIDPSLAEFTGRIDAIIPDTRRTFERFVYSLTTDEAKAQRVIRNPIFQIFAKELSGTNEYMALQKLYSIAHESDYDCIVLDTPPSRNTLAFLEAPTLLARLFEEKYIRWLAVPANQLMAGGIRMALGILEKLTGAGFMTSLMEFAAALFEVQGAFTANLAKITELLKSDRTGFIMVTTPTPDTTPDIRHFLTSLSEHHMRFDGVAINRTLGYLGQAPESEKSADDASRKQAYDLVDSLQGRERRILDEIRKTRTPICGELPELARDVHSVEDLFHVAMAFSPR